MGTGTPENKKFNTVIPSATKEDYPEGQLLLIDKPLGWTSFQAVNHIKWTLKKKFGFRNIKVGHAGTLDPLATGLLLVCTGKFTKKIQELQSLPKEYTGSIQLGATTPSYDLETPVDREFPISHITESLIREKAMHFIGMIQQHPPMYSALKKGGKRLYELARNGQNIPTEPRSVSISELEITTIRIPEIRFRVVCSKGTYIRSLAHDLGLALGSGGHLTALKRTKTGDYNVNIALTPGIFREKLFAESS